MVLAVPPALFPNLRCACRFRRVIFPPGAARLALDPDFVELAMHRLLLALLFVVSHANAYDLKLPSPDWEAAQVAVRTFQADLAAWEKEAAFFDFPATEPAWPCNVGTDERYQAAGLMMALPDFAAKQAKLTRKHFRELGMDAEPVKKIGKYEDIRILPLRAACKAGKLDGEVEVLAQYVMVSQFENTVPFKERYINSKTTSRMSHTQRVVSRFEGGVFKGMVRTIGKMFSNTETVYDDAEFNSLMKSNSSMVASAALTADIQKRPTITFSYVGKGNFASFSISQEPVISAGLLGVNADFKDKLRVFFSRPTGDDTDEFISYENGLLSMRSPRRGGKMHGEMVTWSPNYLKASGLRLDQMPNMERARIVEINGVELIENRQCFIDGVLTKTTDCPAR